MDLAGRSRTTRTWRKCCAIYTSSVDVRRSRSNDAHPRHGHTLPAARRRRARAATSRCRVCKWKTGLIDFGTSGWRQEVFLEGERPFDNVQLGGIVVPLHGEGEKTPGRRGA